jgi:hypothetical protein
MGSKLEIGAKEGKLFLAYERYADAQTVERLG